MKDSAHYRTNAWLSAGILLGAGFSAATHDWTMVYFLLGYSATALLGNLWLSRIAR